MPSMSITIYAHGKPAYAVYADGKLADQQRATSEH